MSKYSITFSRSAAKELEALGVSVLNRVFAKIESLESEPRPYGTRKLTGENDLWRIRVGDYRVVYRIKDGEHLIDVISVRHRKDAYR
jgi:mRNA interferase RelE/StbE